MTRKPVPYRTGTEDYILALDSSSRQVTFALGTPNGEVLSVETDKDFRYAEAIVQHVGNLFRKSGTSLDQVGRLAAGVGPGSFTGHRVGLAAAKALMLGKRIPCFVVSSLDVIAHNAVGRVGKGISYIRVLVDARRSRYYTALYEIRKGTLSKTSSDRIVTAEELEKSVEGKTALVGDGLATFSLEASTFLKENVQCFSESDWYPRAARIVELLRKDSPLLRRVELSGLLPAYLRPTEPEEKLIAEKKGC